MGFSQLAAQFHDLFRSHERMTAEEEKELFTGKFKDDRGLHGLRRGRVRLAIKKGGLPEHITWSIDLQDHVFAGIGGLDSFSFSFFDDMKPFGSIAFKEDIVVFLKFFFREKLADLPLDGF